MENGKLIFANDVLTSLRTVVEDVNADKLFFLCDDNTHRHCLGAVIAPDVAGIIIEVEHGEAHKSVETLTQVWKSLSNGGASRRSLLINVGGGMVTDIGGFAAATFKRGIRYVNVPTTLLAMVDASTGAKTGVNFNGLKNEIGAFHAPLATIICPQFLNTLPAEEFYSGYAEMLKHGLIDSETAWTSLLSDEDPYAHRGDMIDEVERSVEIKKRITDADPYEKGLRKTLNFGHTVGHAFESLAMERGEDVSHGRAVAWGMACELYLSAALLDFPTDTLRATLNYIKTHFAPLTLSCVDYPQLYAYMLHDKKNSGAGVNFTLLKNIGAPRTDNIVGQELIDEALDFCREGI